MAQAVDYRAQVLLMRVSRSPFWLYQSKIDMAILSVSGLFDNISVNCPGDFQRRYFHGRLFWRRAYYRLEDKLASRANKAADTLTIIARPAMFYISGVDEPTENR